MSDDEKGKKKKGKGRWGMGFSAMAMAGQRLKSRLQRTRKMEAMSSEFTDLNQVRRPVCGGSGAEWPASAGLYRRYDGFCTKWSAAARGVW